MTSLYSVATPIGNLGDISFRAVEILKSSDFVIAEDTRRTKILFQHYDISTPLISCHAKTSPAQIQKIVDKIEQNQQVAFVSDAGTPGISDPGFSLLREVLSRKHIHISSIPGASAFLTLLAASGVPSNAFAFHGFIPHKKGRQTFLKNFRENFTTQIFYESVHRFPRLLSEFVEHIGEERVIVVGRELTKMHESIFRGNIGEAQSFFTEENTKGEFVVIIPPCDFRFA